MHEPAHSMSVVNGNTNPWQGLINRFFRGTVRFWRVLERNRKVYY